jgi:hypothetical protein
MTVYDHVLIGKQQAGQHDAVGKAKRQVVATPKMTTPETLIPVKEKPGKIIHVGR